MWTAAQVKEIARFYNPDLCEYCEGVGGFDLVDETGEADYMVCSHCEGKGETP